MKMKTIFLIAPFVLFLLTARTIFPQIATGGNYKLEQAVIASGGGTSAETGGQMFLKLANADSMTHICKF